MSFADTTAAGTTDAQRQSLDVLERQAGAIRDANRAHYSDREAQQTAIETPDAKLNEAFSWAETAIDQLRVQTAPGGRRRR